MKEASVLEHQLEFLKLEIETINSSIRQMDDITKSVKEWTIGLWTAAVGGALVTENLSPYVALTALIPLLFWLVDTWHRRIQRKFIWRNIQISKFLNSDDLVKSFENDRLTGFPLFDPKARLSKNDGEYTKFVSWRQVMLFRSLSILYLGLAVISLILGVLHHWFLQRSSPS